MATVAKYLPNITTFDNETQFIRVIYDFAVDAGAVGVLDLFEAGQALVVQSARMKVMTTCTSGGSATVSFGKVGDLTGLVGATAVASLVAGANFYSGARDASNTMAADAVIQMEIATAALTAGKIEFIFEVQKA